MKLGRRRTARAEEAIRVFKPDADALESLPLPFPGKTLLYVIIGLVVAGVVWASLSNVDRVVTAKGRLVTTAPRIVIQALETSIIKDLHVKAGDRVRAGQLVASLDPTFVGADITALTAQRKRVHAQIERLEAEVEEREYLPQREGTETGLQRSINEQKRAEMEARLRSFDRKADEMRAAKARNTNRLRHLRGQLDALVELEERRAEALDKGAGSRIEVLEARVNRLELSEQIEAIERQQTEIDHRLRSNAAERELHVHTSRRKTFEELIETQRQLDALEQSLTKGLRRGSAIRLIAPRDAIVLEIAERSVGSILREAETLMTLVPADSELELLAELAPLYVGKVKIGDPTRIKIDAFPFQSHGTLDGEVRTISSDAFIKEEVAGEMLSYRANITLKSTVFSRRPLASPLRAGMTATSEIIIGRRSVLSFLLYPVIRAIDEAVREP